MQKNCFLTLLFSISFIINANAFSSAFSSKFDPVSVQEDICNEPPPDSFRVTGYGYNFVSVAWEPIAPVANYHITVLQEDETNGWITLTTIIVQNDTTYTISNLDMQLKHKLELRTVCPNGEPGSSFVAAIPPHGLIIELTANGNRPIEPQPGTCGSLNFVDHIWVGFKLTKEIGEGETISSLFEYELVQSGGVEARIKRKYEPIQGNGPILVAANEIEAWPLHPKDKKDTKTLRFQVGEINQNGFENFGYVTVNSPINGTVSVCTTQVINPPYYFEALVADKVEVCLECPTGDQGGNTGGYARPSLGMAKVRVENPISDYIQMFFDENEFQSGIYTITLTDLSGRCFFREQIDIPEPRIAIPLGYIPPGLLLLNVEYNGCTQTLKVIR
ncbi:MAG: fibronectin type III domain-containing protein [Lewinellaceae bacterium]|nr:fibronectin type III domain-containing protein [Saprospiraceae bacterium]MCB9343539.1 fibronectin type III domain-containing protein [Lewinellaceae bacterium]